MTNTLFLSHVLDRDTPLYGGSGEPIQIESLRSMACGDTCNALRFSMPCHAGTHVDLPAHFVEGGKTADDYSAAEWTFAPVGLLELSGIEPSEPLGASVLEGHGLDPGLELLIVKTGFGRHRGMPLYGKSGPVFLPELADALRKAFPRLRAMGMDTISLSSWSDRDTGRSAHRQFLGGDRPILLIEDMDLGLVTPQDRLERVIVAPLRLRRGDGVPCTVLAEGEFR